MADGILKRVGPNAWILEGEDDQLQRVKIGAAVRVKWAQIRSYEFLKKYMALIDTAFDWWEPNGAMEYMGRPIRKNSEAFRKNVQILAGYGYPVYAVDGSMRMESESISFARMKEVEFQKLYSAVLDVILDKVLSRADEQRLNEAVDAIMSYA